MVSYQREKSYRAKKTEKRKTHNNPNTHALLQNAEAANIKYICDFHHPVLIQTKTFITVLTTLMVHEETKPVTIKDALALSTHLCTTISFLLRNKNIG